MIDSDESLNEEQIINPTESGSELSQSDEELCSDENIPEDDEPGYGRCCRCMEKLARGAKFCAFCGRRQEQQTAENYHLIPGTELADRYVVGMVLGSGGFGVTYLGWDKKLRRKTAIKEYMPTEFATRIPGSSELTVFTGEKEEQFEIGRKKFSDEGQVLAGCNSVPGVVRIYDVFYANGTAYLVMEYLEGETLKTRLSREGTLSSEEALKIIVPVLDALDGIHSSGLIHRDVAPDNIFLCKNGDVKLIDFGAARYATTSFSRSLSIILKSGYSPEEQYRSRGEQGPWTDIYAAGATLFRMLTGVTPPDAMERTSNDILRTAVAASGRTPITCGSFRRLRYRMAGSFYRRATKGGNSNTGKPSGDVPDDIKSLRRASFAAGTYRRITGSMPESAEKNEELFAAAEKLKSVPRNVNIAMMNALNVYHGDRTKSALQFKKELTGEVETKPIRLRSNKNSIGKMPTWIKATGVAAAAVLVVGIVLLISMISGASSDLVETPEIINQMSDKAEQIVLKKDLGYLIVDSQASDKVPVNKVMLQEPEAMTRVKKGTVVRVTISMGAEKVSVPNFVGMTKKEAEKELDRLNLKGEYIEEFSSVEKGRICAQGKKAESRIAAGSIIRLTVSLGLEEVDAGKKVKMPKITGLTLEQATTRLAAVNLYLTIEKEKYDDRPAGTVLSQSVKSGSEISEGSTVKVSVSKGKEMSVVPYVTFKTEKEAIELLKKANLKSSVKYEYSDWVVKGNVVSQSISSEKKVAPGTAVELVVSKGKKKVTVPNVLGSKTANAVSTIEGIGLQVTVREELSDSVAPGIVIRQSPAAKTEVSNGTTVTITVSKKKQGVTVPSVSGKTCDEARSILTEKGFEVKTVEQYSDTVAAGNVISQSPVNGSLLPEGSTVTVYVSKGAQELLVPNVVGKTSSKAYSMITEKGLKVIEEKAYSNSVAEGKVISQSPAANSPANKGDTVLITVSMGKEPVTVPDE